MDISDILDCFHWRFCRANIMQVVPVCFLAERSNLWVYRKILLKINSTKQSKIRIMNLYWSYSKDCYAVFTRPSNDPPAGNEGILKTGNRWIWYSDLSWLRYYLFLGRWYRGVYAVFCRSMCSQLLYLKLGIYGYWTPHQDFDCWEEATCVATLGSTLSQIVLHCSSKHVDWTS